MTVTAAGPAGRQQRRRPRRPSRRAPTGSTTPRPTASPRSSRTPLRDAERRLRRARDVDDGRAVQLGGVVRHHHGLHRRHAHGPGDVTAHAVPLHGLKCNTLYHYRVRSTDPGGNATQRHGPDLHERRLPDAADLRRVQRRDARHEQVGVHRPARRLRELRRTGAAQLSVPGRTGARPVVQRPHRARGCCRPRRTPTSRSSRSSTPASARRPSSRASWSRKPTTSCCASRPTTRAARPRMFVAAIGGGTAEVLHRRRRPRRRAGLPQAAPRGQHAGPSATPTTARPGARRPSTARSPCQRDRPVRRQRRQQPAGVPGAGRLLPRDHGPHPARHHAGERAGRSAARRR